MSRFSNLKSFIYAEDQKSSAFVDSKDTNAQVTENAVSEDSVVQKVGMPTDSRSEEHSLNSSHRCTSRMPSSA